MQSGDIVLVKTTGQEVFILKLMPAPPLADATPAPFEQIAIVRAPSTGQDGIRYDVTEFFLEELETKHDQLERDYNDMMAIQKKLHKSDSDPSAVKSLVPSDQVN